MTVTINGTTGITSPADSISGNLTFTGTGNRITGDFSNATAANRVLFQTSTSNSYTQISAIPSGTNTIAQFDALGASDPTNASRMSLRVEGGVDASIRSSREGTGTYLPMTFYTGGSERMRIDTSGNVGIGTSSPGGDLHVARADAAELVLQATNSGGRVWYIQTGDTASGVSGALRFFDGTASAERMRIDSGGNLLVGTTSATPSAGGIKLTFNSGTSFFQADHVSGSSTNSYYAAFTYAGTLIGHIDQSGTNNVAYVTSSDYRLKENIQPMQNALATVAQLNPVTYNWKADGSDGQGFIAHELQAVVPDCVTGEKDAVDAGGKPVYQGIDTSFLVATLTKAIQELTARVIELENK